jgi:hypothetical protein
VVGFAELLGAAGAAEVDRGRRRGVRRGLAESLAELLVTQGCCEGTLGERATENFAELLDTQGRGGGVEEVGRVLRRWLARFLLVNADSCGSLNAGPFMSAEMSCM